MGHLLVEGLDAMARTVLIDQDMHEDVELEAEEMAEGEDDVGTDGGDARDPMDEVDKLDSDESNSESELEEFTLKFSVSVNGAHEFLQIDSGATWGEVQKQLADVLEVPPKAVRVAYHFSTEPRNAPHKHLNKPAHLIELVESAQHAMNTTKSKKEFIVELKDISGAVDKGKASKRGRKGKHVKSKRGIHTDNDLSGSDASDDINN
ncbi:hypothetical protein PC9H_005974, partial [Pleurotus ostreatus]